MKTRKILLLFAVITASIGLSSCSGLFTSVGVGVSSGGYYSDGYPYGYWNGYNGYWNGYPGYFGPTYPTLAPRPVGRPNPPANPPVNPPSGGSNRPVQPGNNGNNIAPNGTVRPGNMGLGQIGSQNALPASGSITVEKPNSTRGR